MLPPHLIVSTDFDGTLTSPSSPDILSPEFMQWISEARKKNRVTWIINTGRSWESLSAELERRKSVLWPDWAVLIERHICRVHKKSSQPLEAWNNRCNQVHEKLFQKTTGLWERMRTEFRHHPDLQMVKDIGCPLGFIADSEKQADEIDPRVQEMIADYPDLILIRNSIYFRFGQRDFTKGSCLREIAAQEGLGAEACFASGDHCNDLSMLHSSAARFICCPANSADRVKQQVTYEKGYVSKLPYSAGVVDGLNHYFA